MKPEILAIIPMTDVPFVGERSIFEMFSPSTPKDQDWEISMREGLRDKEAPVKEMTAPADGNLTELQIIMAQKTLICRPPVRLLKGEKVVVMLDMDGFHLIRYGGATIMSWDLFGNLKE